jgi:hypothetical protein
VEETPQPKKYADDFWAPRNTLPTAVKQQTTVRQMFKLGLPVWTQTGQQGVPKAQNKNDFHSLRKSPINLMELR